MSWQNSSRVTSVRNSGRSSRARHNSAVSTARDRQRAGPPGAVGQRGLDDRGLAGAVDEPGGEGDRLVADAAAGGGQGQAAAAHRRVSARQRARKAPLEQLMPGTWRA